MQTETLEAVSPTIGNTVLGVVPVWKLRQEHDEEIKRVMEETGCTFRKWNGKAFWELANKCGHTSLDFDKCDCKRHYA